jgi:TonB family protein
MATAPVPAPEALRPTIPPPDVPAVVAEVHTEVPEPSAPPKGNTVRSQAAPYTGWFDFPPAPARPRVPDPAAVQVGKLEPGGAAAPVAPNRVAVVAAGFGSAETAPPRAVSPLRAARTEFGSVEARPARFAGPAPADDRSTALEILDKPRPVYSEEARQLRLEGVVLLEMSFSAAGQARVLRVLRGLGHGLDENALKAALGIQFRPALEHGRPVDTVASVRIEFQLAY